MKKVLPFLKIFFSPHTAVISFKSKVIVSIFSNQKAKTHCPGFYYINIILAVVNKIYLLTLLIDLLPFQKELILH